MTFFNAQPYNTLPSDLIEQFMQGQQMVGDLRARQAQNETLAAQNRYKSNIYNDMLRQHMQGRTMSVDEAQNRVSEMMNEQGSGSMPMAQHMQGRTMPVDEVQNRVSEMMNGQGPGAMPMVRRDPQYIQRKLIQNQLLNFPDPKQQVIDGQNFIIFPDGEAIPFGPGAPTERQKEFTKKDAEKYDKLQDEYSGLIETQSIVQGLEQLISNPKMDEYLSSSTSYPLRAAANFYNRATGKDDRAEYIAQLSDLGSRLVNAAAKDFKGSFTNQELSFLQSQKPNPNDTPIQLRTKVANLQKFMQEKMSRTEYVLDRMENYNESYAKAVKAFKESDSAMHKTYLNDNDEEKALAQPEDKSTLIAQSMQGENPQDGNPPKGPEASGINLSNILKAISGQMAGGVPLASIAAPARGVAQSAYDAAKSVGNLVPEAVEYTTGYNMGRIPQLDIMDPEAKGAEGVLQNLGYYGAPLMANVSALPMASGAIGRASQAANLGPKAAALAQMLGIIGTGAAEGFALGEGNRGMNAFISALAAAIPGGIEAGRGYVKELSSTGIGKKIAKNVKSAERSLGAEIGAALKKGKDAGAKITMPAEQIQKDSLYKALKSRFKNESGAIDVFIKNPTLENAHWAQSAIGEIERNLAQPAKKAYGNRTNEQLKEYAKELGNKVKAAMSQAFQDAGVDPSLYDSARRNYSNFTDLAKSQPMQSFEKIKNKTKNVLDADYAELADRILKDKRLTESAIPYAGGLSDRATIEALNKLISQYGKTALFASGVGTGVGYGINQITKGD